MHVERAVADLVRRFELAHDELAAVQHTQRHFCGVYLRSTAEHAGRAVPRRLRRSGLGRAAHRRVRDGLPGRAGGLA
jgi:hypothetical protein